MGCAGGYAVGADRSRAGQVVTELIDVAAEQRWTAWKTEGARLEAIRAGRMRALFTTVGIGVVVWLLWSL